MEMLKLEIESDLSNIAVAYDLDQDDIKVQRYIKRTRESVYRRVCKLGREITQGYVKTNRRAYELGEEYLNQQGVDL